MNYLGNNLCRHRGSYGLKYLAFGSKFGLRDDTYRVLMDQHFTYQHKFTNRLEPLTLLRWVK